MFAITLKGGGQNFKMRSHIFLVCGVLYAIFFLVVISCSMLPQIIGITVKMAVDKCSSTALSLSRIYKTSGYWSQYCTKSTVCALLCI